jgi:acyl carrier protein
MGVDALSNELGLELYDQARQHDEALLVPLLLDQSALRAQARAGMLPALLRGLVRVPARRAESTGGSLPQRLAGVPQADRERVVLELVQAQVAAVLGHTSAEAIDPARAFKALGFDSLASVELRNRLTQATGMRLPTTLVFDHPTSASVAGFLVTEVGGPDEPGRSPLEEGIQQIEALLATVAGDEQRLAELERLSAFSNRLRFFLNELESRHDDTDQASDDDLDEVSDEEMFELIDKEFGPA